MFTNLDPTLTINQNKFLLSNPNWVITNKTSKHTYKLTSSQASVNFSNEKFIIKKASVKTLLENKIENSISSDEANLELDKKKLVLKKKVHLQLPQTNGTIHLFTELLNLDLKNNLVFTNYEVELKSEDEVVNLPKWAIEEVTGNERYYNAYLSKHPYCDWEK